MSYWVKKIIIISLTSKERQKSLLSQKLGILLYINKFKMPPIVRDFLNNRIGGTVKHLNTNLILNSEMRIWKCEENKLNHKWDSTVNFLPRIKLLFIYYLLLSLTWSVYKIPTQVTVPSVKSFGFLLFYREGTCDTYFSLRLGIDSVMPSLNGLMQKSKHSFNKDWNPTGKENP